jgi:hypothetical protein
MILLVIAVIPAAGAIGYLVGRTNAPTAAEARAEQAAVRLTEAGRAAPGAFAAGRRRGLSAGTKQGRRRGRRTGERRGERIAAKDFAAAQPPATTITSVPTNGCPSGLERSGTEACVLAGGTPAGCGGDPYSTPNTSGGCIGPAHPPSTGPARPEDGPPGQVPVGVTGACAPD